MSYGRCLAYYKTEGNWDHFQRFCQRSNHVVGKGVGAAGKLLNNDYMNIKAAWNGQITHDFYIALVIDWTDNPRINCPFWYDGYNGRICPDYPLFQSDLPDGNNFNDTNTYQVAMIPANFSYARQWKYLHTLKAVLCEFGKCQCFHPSRIIYSLN